MASRKVAKQQTEKELLSPEQRAEDIILGALGFGEDASIIEIRPIPPGFSGRAAWSDGEEFEFSSDDEPSALESWALGILFKKRGS